MGGIQPVRLSEMEKALQEYVKEHSFIDIDYDSTDNVKDWGCDKGFVARELTKHVNRVVGKNIMEGK